MEYIIIALLAVVLIVQIVILVKAAAKKEDKTERVLELVKDVQKEQGVLKLDVIKELSEGATKNQDTIRRSLLEMQESTEKRLVANSNVVNESIVSGLKSIQEANDRKLSDIQRNMDEKLEKNLHSRLDESFKQVGEQLASLYQSLGELKSLESGVTNLNKTLSNVKSRGVFGEMALENLLANILDGSQYETNVATRPRSAERVEFAVKIPDKQNKGYIYLPIDSKFPADIYGKVLEASENADVDNLKLAINELKTRIRKEAMTIRDKYVAPP
ncbi:MAG: DNA recombination protein RmuC, partial [Tyzzerella sp.]|nr:DNA recombination protein RmuC [Tyzzerella sp.]